MAKILLVDDEPDMRLALANVLKKEGHETCEAGNGEAALQEIDQRPVELVLLDLRLPGMDGTQTLKRIREKRVDLPVVMVTGYGSVDTAVKVMELGATAYLAKPFGNRQLIETVEKVLEVKRLSQESGTLHQGLLDKLRGVGAGAAAGSARARRKAALRWTFRAAFAAAVLIAGSLVVREALDRRPRALELPFSNPTAAVWRGDELWTADWLTKTVYRFKREGDTLKAVQTFELPGTHITGLTLGEDALYTCDGWRRVIQKRRLDDELTLVAEKPSPGSSPSGLFWGDRYLWSCDAEKGRIYRQDQNTLEVVDEFPSPAKAPVALFRSSGYLWTADADTRLIYLHRLDEKLTVLDELHHHLLEAGEAPLSAMGFDGKAWWIARDGENRLLRLHPKTLKRAKSS
jgi:CheY-like chemotaxis protein